MRSVWSNLQKYAEHSSLGKSNRNRERAETVFIFVLVHGGCSLTSMPRPSTYKTNSKVKIRILRSSWNLENWETARAMSKVTNCIVVLVQIYIAKGMHRFKEIRVRTEYSFWWWRSVDAVGCTALCLCEPTEAVASVIIIWRLPGFIS